jgi:hypothetical protein
MLAATTTPTAGELPAPSPQQPAPDAAADAAVSSLVTDPLAQAWLADRADAGAGADSASEAEAESRAVMPLTHAAGAAVAWEPHLLPVWDVARRTAVSGADLDQLVLRLLLEHYRLVCGGAGDIEFGGGRVCVADDGLLAARVLAAARASALARVTDAPAASSLLPPAVRTCRCIKCVTAVMRRTRNRCLREIADADGTIPSPLSARALALSVVNSPAAIFTGTDTHLTGHLADFLLATAPSDSSTRPPLRLYPTVAQIEVTRSLMATLLATVRSLAPASALLALARLMPCFYDYLQHHDPITRDTCILAIASLAAPTLHSASDTTAPAPSSLLRDPTLVADLAQRLVGAYLRSHEADWVTGAALSVYGVEGYLAEGLLLDLDAVNSVHSAANPLMRALAGATGADGEEDEEDDMCLSDREFKALLEAGEEDEPLRALLQQVPMRQRTKKRYDLCRCLFVIVN